MTGLSSVTCVLLLGLQLTGVLAQFRGQWGQWGLGGGGGYFQRPRAQRFAAYGGYPGVRGREFNVPLTSDKSRENWPENSLSSRRTSPFKFQQQTIQVTTARPTTTTTTRPTTTVTTTTTIRTTTSAPTTRKVKEFIPVLRTSTETIAQEMDPYLSIDVNRFPVIAAVPGNPETTVLSRAVPSGISVTESQAPSSASSRVLPPGFSPVPAVPGPAPASSAPLVITPAPVIAREKPTVAQTKFISSRLEKEVVEEKEPVAERVTVIDERTQRKQFKRCHGKCVQKFCLPIDSLTVYDTCSAKCKGICSQ